VLRHTHQTPPSPCQVSTFLQYAEANAVSHLEVGFQMLSTLVNEMNNPIDGESYAKHRKVSTSFRDQSLLKVFKSALETLGRVRQGALVLPDKQTEGRLTHKILGVTLQCLCFDYIGMNPDDASEDAGTIQIPTSWRPVLETGGVLNTFFDILLSPANEFEYPGTRSL
jgi:exportin-7